MSNWFASMQEQRTFSGIYQLDENSMSFRWKYIFTILKCLSNNADLTEKNMQGFYLYYEFAFLA